MGKFRVFDRIQTLHPEHDHHRTGELGPAPCLATLSDRRPAEA